MQKELPEIQKNITLKDYTSFKIGGKAKYFFAAETKEDIIKVIKVAKKLDLPFFILGGGSNLLVTDKGFDGLVIKIQNTKYPALEQAQYGASKIPCDRVSLVRGRQDTKIYTEAGATLGNLVGASTKAGLTGLEWATGIPGTIGGAIRGNAGAFGKSIKEIVKEVEVFDVEDEKIKIFKNKDCKFKYRDSIFKQNPSLIILSAIIQLRKGNKKTLQEKIKNYLAHRRENQPLNFPSAGSVFKNYQGKIKNQKLLEKFPELKEFNKKQIIPAGWLIEKCGLKGKKINNVKISEKHCNFIVNLGKGKAKDVIALIELIKQKVKSKFKIILEEEIVILF